MKYAVLAEKSVKIFTKKVWKNDKRIESLIFEKPDGNHVHRGPRVF